MDTIIMKQVVIGASKVLPKVSNGSKSSGTVFSPQQETTGSESFESRTEGRKAKDCTP